MLQPLILILLRQDTCTKITIDNTYDMNANTSSTTVNANFANTNFS